VEALNQALLQLPRDEVAIQVISMAVGEVGDKDLEMAETTSAIVASFNDKMGNKTINPPKKGDKVTLVFQDRIIYNILDKLRDHISTLLKPRIEVEISASANLQEVFRINTKGGDIAIAGCLVTAGTIKRGSPIRIVRDGKSVHQGKVTTLKHFKADIPEVNAGMECGIGVDYDDIQVGDQLEVFKVTKIPRKLGDPKTSTVIKVQPPPRKESKESRDRR
jgi:translation initiation factor IF-2